MKEILGNGLDTIVSQALQKMKEEQGESFHIETVNLAALQRMTGISRGRLRRWKKNLLSPEHNFRKRKQDRHCKDQYANPKQPEEFPTAVIHTEIRKLPLPASNLSFEKFNFDKGGEQDE